jgi:hypothetical protein
MPSVARSPMPSWLARKLNHVAVELTGPTPLAQSLSRAVDPATNECSTSGGKANWYTRWASSSPLPK